MAKIVRHGTDVCRRYGRLSAQRSLFWCCWEKIAMNRTWCVISFSYGIFGRLIFISLSLSDSWLSMPTEINCLFYICTFGWKWIAWFSVPRRIFGRKMKRILKFYRTTYDYGYFVQTNKSIAAMEHVLPKKTQMNKFRSHKFHLHNLNPSNRNKHTYSCPRSQSFSHLNVFLISFILWIALKFEFAIFRKSSCHFKYFIYIYMCVLWWFEMLPTG